MRRDAVFGDLVHPGRPDLQLDPLIARTDHRRVDRAVVVLFRGRDVVLEPARHDRPGGVDDPERLIALRHRVHDGAEAENIRELFEAERLELHLAPDRIGMLAAPGHAGGDPARGKLGRELMLDFADQIAVAGGERVEPRADDLERLRMQLLEGEVFQFAPHRMHAHASGQRRIDIDRLLRHPPPQLGRHMRDGAHIVQAIGELHEQHAHVFGDGEQKLAQILGLLGLARDQFEPVELGEALDELPDVAPEHRVDLGAGRLGVLDRVVQKRGGDRRIVELQVGEDGGDFERMREIRVARSALLAAMRAHRVDIGAVEQILVGLRIVLPHPLDQLVLAHHPLRRGDRRFDRLRRGLRRRLARRVNARLNLHPRQTGDRRAQDEALL